MLRASYSLAFYGLLRPTEYMLTPLHSTFDATRHMRACDIQFYRRRVKIDAHAPEAPDSFSVNIKMAKYFCTLVCRQWRKHKLRESP